MFQGLQLAIFEVEVRIRGEQLYWILEKQCGVPAWKVIKKGSIVETATHAESTTADIVKWGMPFAHEANQLRKPIDHATNNAKDQVRSAIEKEMEKLESEYGAFP